MLDDVRTCAAPSSSAPAWCSPRWLGWWIAAAHRPPDRAAARHRETIATTQDLHTTIPAGGDGEVGSLSPQLHHDGVGAGDIQEEQQRLVSDASHEMRTPLTSLTSNVELLGQFERLAPADRADVLGAIGARARRADPPAHRAGRAGHPPSAQDEPAEPLVLADVGRDVARAPAAQRPEDLVEAVDSTPCRPGPR